MVVKFLDKQQSPKITKKKQLVEYLFKNNRK
jgi:hypothetical protein